MLTKLLFTVLFATLVFQIQSQNIEKSVIDIGKNALSESEKSNLNSENEGKVLVNKILKPGLNESAASDTKQFYEILFYHYLNGKMQVSEVSYGTPINFTNCEYSWTNDSTVAIKLFNPDIKETLEFDVFGVKGGSGIRTYD